MRIRVRHIGPLTLLLALATALPAQAVDAVRRGKQTLNGEITAMTATEVTIKVREKDEVVPVNEIAWIRFDQEPTQLQSARTALEAGRFEDAVKALERVNAEELTKDWPKQDYEYLKALSTARLAQAGTGDLADAGRGMNEWIKSYPDNYRWLDANEVVGDLLLASDDFDNAAKYYGKVEDKALWPDVKMRAGVSKGRTLLRQGKAAEALTVLEGVLSLAQGSEGDLVARQKMMATVAKAEALAAQDKADEGIALVDELIATASPDEKELHALAYTALGNCHRKAGRKKEARMAFLHVHILYPTYPELHAESLANLVELWQELGDAARSQEAKDILQERYGNTRWAKQSS
jgi:tetratricopeptide (TPR) repeat protein